MKQTLAQEFLDNLINFSDTNFDIIIIGHDDSTLYDNLDELTSKCNLYQSYRIPVELSEEERESRIQMVLNERILGDWQYASLVFTEDGSIVNYEIQSQFVVVDPRQK